jgi:hypothetical protein
MLLLFVSLALPVLVGFCLSSLFLPGKKSLRSRFFLKISLAVGLGLGLAACFFFYGLVLLGSAGSPFVVTELTLLIILSFILFYIVKQRSQKANLQHIPEPETKWKFDWLFPTAFSFLLVFAVAVFVMKSMNNPVGTQDAWNVWNFRAKFLYGAGEHWRDVYHLNRHLDLETPLLIAGSVARLWTYAKNTTTAAPMLIALLFTLSTIGLLVSSLSFFRSRNLGFIAGLFLLSTPLYISRAASQCSDIPLSFFILATLVMLCFKERAKGEGLRFVFLSGVTAGLASWTKNEGFMFLLFLFITRFLIVLSEKGWKAYFRETLFFVAGLLPVFMTVLYFKIQLAPPHFLFAQEFPIVLSKLTDVQRYLYTAKSFPADFFQVFKTRLIIFPALFLLLGLFYRNEYKTVLKNNLLVLFLMLSGYFFVFIITPHTLAVEIETSLKRFYLQLLPAAYFTLFLIIASPEECLSKKPQSNK